MLYFLTISGYLSILNPPKKSCVYMVLYLQKNPVKSCEIPMISLFHLEEPYARLRKKKLDFVTSALRCVVKDGEKWWDIGGS